MDRRTLLKLMLSSALAEAVDFEKLLWVPKPIVTVPAMPRFIVDGNIFSQRWSTERAAMEWIWLDTVGFYHRRVAVSFDG